MWWPPLPPVFRKAHLPISAHVPQFILYFCVTPLGPHFYFSGFAFISNTKGKRYYEWKMCKYVWKNSSPSKNEPPIPIKRKCFYLKCKQFQLTSSSMLLNASVFRGHAHWGRIRTSCIYIYKNAQDFYAL